MKEEQQEGNTMLLTSLSQMKEGTQAVEQAAKNLQDDTEIIMGRISKIGQQQLILHFPTRL